MPGPVFARHPNTSAALRIHLFASRPHFCGQKFSISRREPDGVQRSAMELEGATVLVVEDDDDTREMIRAMLELCGATVLVAESAKSGLEAFLRSRPDAIVSDIAMPGADRYSLPCDGARPPAAPGLTALPASPLA